MDEGLTAFHASDLVGTWQLRSWQLQGPDGSIEQPFGERPEGLLVYTADGRMITIVSEPDRPVDSPRFHSYGGTFSVEGGDVIHHVELSHLPDWVGSEQRRQVELEPGGQSLTLSSPPVTVGGHAGRHRLTWARVTD